MELLQGAVLRRGDFNPVGTRSDVACAGFQRKHGTERILVVMNRGDSVGKIQIPRPAGWSGARVTLATGDAEDVLISEESGIFSVELAPLTAALLENSTPG